MAFLANQLHQVTAIDDAAACNLVSVLPVLGTSVDDVYHRVKTATSIAVHGSVRVHVSSGSGGLCNTRITERMQRFILVRTIDALLPAVDDPYN
jgi:predicted ATPase